MSRWAIGFAAIFLAFVLAGDGFAKGGHGGNGRIHINGTISGPGVVVPAATFGPGEPPVAAAAQGGWAEYE